MMVLVEYAAQVVGYDTYMKALTAVVKGGGILGILLQNDYVSMMYPLMDLLKDFGITGPNGLLRVYYYGSYHELQRKIDLESVRRGHRTGDVGVLAENCPHDILDYVGKYAAAAQWLYSSTVVLLYVPVINLIILSYCSCQSPSMKTTGRLGIFHVLLAKMVSIYFFHR